MRGKDKKDIRKKIGDILTLPIKAGSKNGVVSDVESSGKNTISNTKYLSEIAKNTKAIMTFLLNNSTKSSVNISTSSILTDVSKDPSLVSKTAAKNAKSMIKKSSMLSESVNSDGNNEKPITTYLSEIVSLLTKISNGNAKGGGKKSKDVKIATVPKGAASELSSINAAVEKLSQLSNKSISVVTRLINALKSIGKKNNVSQIKAGAAAISAMSNSLKGISSVAAGTVKDIKSLMKHFTILLMLTTSQIFIKGVEYIKGFFSALKGTDEEKPKAVKNAVDYKYMFLSIAIGIGAIVGSLILLTMVPWQSVVALLAFLTALAGIVFLLTYNQRGRNVSKINDFSRNTSSQSFSGINPIASVAIGIALLLLAIFAVQDVDWQQALVLVAFVAALTMIVTIPNVVGKKGGQLTGMVGFAFGVSILVLAAYAVEEVFGVDGKFDIKNPSTWAAGPFLLVAFMFAIAGAVALGGVSKGMFGFAMGVTILVLSIWAVNEMIKENGGAGPVLLAASIVLLVALVLGFAIFIAGGGRKKTQVMGVEMVNEPVKRKGVLEFIFVMITLTLSIWVLSTIKEPKKLLANALIMVGVLYAVSFGISLVVKSMKDVNANRTIIISSIISGVIIIGTAAMWVLSTIKESDKLLSNAFVMVSTMVLVSAGIWAMSKMNASDIIKGGLAMVAVVGIMILGSMAMRILAEVPNDDDLTSKAKMMWISMGVIALGIVALGAIAYTGVGALILATGIATMLSIVGIMYLVSKALKMVGETNLSEDSANLYANNVKTIVSGIINAIGVKDALKMVVKAPGMLISFMLMSSAAETMKNISQAEISKEQAQNFANNFSIFAESFVSIITDGRITNALKDAANGVDALSKMMNLAKSLVDILIALSNSTIKEYEVKDGQQVLKSVTPFDINKLSQEAGKNLAALVIGFVNSFKNLEEMSRKELKNIKKTMNSLKGFNEVFSSIGNLLQSADVLSDRKKVDLIRINLANMTNTVIAIAVALQKSKMTAGHFVAFKSFFDILNDVNWDKVGKGTDQLQKNVEKMVKNINAIKLEKVLALKDTMTLFTNLQMKQETNEAIDKIIELIERLEQHQVDLVRSNGDLQGAVDEVSKGVTARNKLEESKGKPVDSETLIHAMNHLANLLSSLDYNVNVKNNVIDVEVQNKVRVVNEMY